MSIFVIGTVCESTMSRYLSTIYSDSFAYSDQSLLNLVKQRDDKTAFAELYNRYWEQLLDTAFQRLKSVEAAEEVVQEVFVQLYVRRKAIHLTSSLNAYLKTALKYKIFNCYRAQQMHHKYVEAMVTETFTNHYSPHEALQGKELNEKIEAVTALMPKKCKEVFLLSRFEHLPHQTIAIRLGITISTVKKHLTKALRILRSELYGYKQDLFAVCLLLTQL